MVKAEVAARKAALGGLRVVDSQPVPAALFFFAYDYLGIFFSLRAATFATITGCFCIAPVAAFTTGPADKVGDADTRHDRSSRRFKKNKKYGEQGPKTKLRKKKKTERQRERGHRHGWIGNK